MAARGEGGKGEARRGGGGGAEEEKRGGGESCEHGVGCWLVVVVRMLKRFGLGGDGDGEIRDSGST